MKPISTTKRWSIVGTAAVFDALGLIPFAGVIINGFGYVVIYSWLWSYGLSPWKAFSDGKSNWIWVAAEWGLYFSSISFVPGLTLNAWSSVNLLDEESREESVLDRGENE